MLHAEDDESVRSELARDVTVSDDARQRQMNTLHISAPAQVYARASLPQLALRAGVRGAVGSETVREQNTREFFIDWRSVRLRVQARTIQQEIQGPAKSRNSHEIGKASYR